MHCLYQKTMKRATYKQYEIICIQYYLPQRESWIHPTRYLHQVMSVPSQSNTGRFYLAMYIHFYDYSFNTSYYLQKTKQHRPVRMHRKHSRHVTGIPCATRSLSLSLSLSQPDQVTLSVGFTFARENPIPFTCSIYFSANSLHSVTKSTPEFL